MSEISGFDESATDPRPAGPGAESLVLSIDGFEGPIDLLLALAREQKVDLHKISILALAEQYLAYISAAKRLRLEIAADYLVMAAWLAYLKSRLLLPEDEQPDDGPTAEEMAELLAFQLRRLEAMREAGVKLMARPQLGRDTFVRGEPEGLPNVTRPVFEVTLFDLLKAYGEHKQRAKEAVLHIEPTGYYSMDDALQRLGGMIGRLPDWTTLAAFLPPELRDDVSIRSAVASMFAAALEMTRSGRVQLRQEQMFGPIFLKSPGPTLVA
ncbi:MAG: segregation/condensation protein A [Alphaproteobacteria bacterium]|nr:segregation/condensation protein A [Alphaproteobacteria bacterium]